MILMLALLLAAERAPAMWDRLPDCRSLTATITEPCAVPARFDTASVTHLIGDGDRVWWQLGDTLTIVARPKERWAMLCCAVQQPLEPIAGTAFAGATVRIPDIAPAIFDVDIEPGEMLTGRPEIRGPLAPPAPPRVAKIAGMQTTVDFPSKALGEKRVVHIYMPPNAPPGKLLPVFYLANDGTGSFEPIAEAAERDGAARPAILVGIANAQGEATGCLIMSVCDRRALEYLPQTNSDPVDGPFARHLRFVVGELIPYVEAHFPASPQRTDRVIGGSSNGGVWAIEGAARRPDVFGNVLIMSAGLRAAVKSAALLGHAKVYGGAGTMEGAFGPHTMADVAAARAAGAITCSRLLVTGHSLDAWDIMFAEAYAWMLPPEGEPPALPPPPAALSALPACPRR
jgi:hypothetical protein